MNKAPQAITRHRALEYLANETDGLIFGVSFTKKDGTFRRMRCRRGVRKGLRGGSLPYDPKSKMLVPVYDMEIGERRNVNVATLETLRIHGQTFVVVD